MKSAGNRVPLRITEAAIQRCFIIFPREIGDARLNRWILVTTNRRLSTEVRRFPPNNDFFLWGKRSHCILEGGRAKTSSTTSQHRSPRFKRRRIVVIVVPPVDELDLVGPIQVF